jgi:hypothetical protein
LPDREYDTAAELYRSSQEQMIKCELQLGGDAEAGKRRDALTRDFPQFAQEIGKSFDTKVVSRVPPSARSSGQRPVFKIQRGIQKKLPPRPALN